MQRIDHTAKHRIISKIWDSSLPGKGTLSRLMTKLLIPKPTGKVVSKTLHGFELEIDPLLDNGVERTLYYFGTYERGTLGFISEHLKEGDVFFDIGANIGLMSLYAAGCVGSEGKVIAFEANPETANILKNNIALNSVNNIDVIAKAVGNDTGSIKIYNNWSVNRGGASVIKPNDASSFSEVELIRIDALKEYQDMTISMVKIDVEGFELDVLKGMEKVLRRKDAPILIVECSATTNKDDTISAIFDFIKGVNHYSVFKLDRTKERAGKLVEVKRREELPHHDNIFCINA